MGHNLRHNANFFVGWVSLLQRNAERVLRLSALISHHLGLGKDLESCQGPPWRRPSQRCMDPELSGLQLLLLCQPLQLLIQPDSCELHSNPHLGGENYYFSTDIQDGYLALRKIGPALCNDPRHNVY